jgi:hypothetical protein
MVATQVNLYDEDMELIISIYDKDGVEFFLVNRQVGK